MRQDKEEKVYELFFENPGKWFTVREIEKKAKVPRATAQRYLSKMRMRGFIDKNNETTNLSMFKIVKSNYFVQKIVSSGLVDELIRAMNPSSIILFGSIAKGESNSESDVDIFVESPIKKIPELKKYEKLLKHPIDLFVESNVSKLQDELFNNVVNGIKLYGRLKLR